MFTHRSRSLFVPLAAVVGAALLVVTGCSDAAGEPSASEGVPAAGPEAAAAALEDGRTVIDVRTPEEYAAGHIEGAVLVDVQASTFDEDIAGLDPDATYVVYCRSGNRSAQAAQRMRDAGLDVTDGGAMTDMESAGWNRSS